MDLISKFHQLRIFYQVASERSFSKAAFTLNISQPSVSIQIRQLEKALGVQLLERIGHKVDLNSTGQMLFEHVSQILDVVNKIDEDLALTKGMKKGRVAVGASKIPSAWILQPAIREFKKKHPDAEINFYVGRSEEVEEKVFRNEVDFAVIVGAPRSSKIITEFLLHEEMVLVLPPHHRLSKKKDISLKEIEHERFLITGSGKLKTFIDNILTANEISLKEQIILGDRDAVKSAINAGFGVSIMAKSTVVRDSKSGFVLAKRIRSNRLKYPINIIVRKDKRLSNLANSFLQFVRAQRASALV